MNPKLRDTPLEIAEGTLLDAGDAIRSRLKEHGHTERSFKMIAELWSVYIGHAYSSREEVLLKPHDIAVMMSMTKIARGVYGYSMDNFVDGAGYTALASMLTPNPTPYQKPASPKVQPIRNDDEMGKVQASEPSSVDGKR
jgi:hypothetical protein